MAFDRNPLTTPADQLVASNTTEDIVRAVTPLIGVKGATISKLGRQTVNTPVTVPDLLAALIARFDRKAAARAEKAAG